MSIDRLESLLRKLPAARLAALLDPSGATLEAVGEAGEADVERMGRTLTEQLRAAGDEDNPLTTGEIGRCVVKTDRYTVFLAPVPNRHHLLLILDVGGSDGQARFELQRACRDLRTESS